MAQGLGNLAGWPIRIYNQPDISPTHSMFNYQRGGQESSVDRIQLPGFNEDGDTISIRTVYSGDRASQKLKYYNSSGSEVWSKVVNDFGQVGVGSDNPNSFAGMVKVGSLIYVLSSNTQSYSGGTSTRLSTINASGTIVSLGVANPSNGVGTMMAYGCNLYKPIGKTNLYLSGANRLHEFDITDGSVEEDIYNNLTHTFFPSYVTGDGRTLEHSNIERSRKEAVLAGSLKAPTAIIDSQTFTNYGYRYNFIQNRLDLTPYGGGKGTGYNGQYVSWIQWGDYCYKVQSDNQDGFTYDFGAWKHTKIEAWHKDYLDFIGSEENGAYAS